MGIATAMNFQDIAESFWRVMRAILWRFFPQTSLRWRNGRLSQVAGFNWLVGLACMLLSAALLGVLLSVLQLLLHQTGVWTSQVAVRQNLLSEIDSLRPQALQVQSELATRLHSISQKKWMLNDLNEQVDALVSQWPNSNLRMPLLSQLQTLALQRGLQVIELKVAPSPNSHGFESSRLLLQMKGSERATYEYWQTLNRVFNNGVWLNVSWLLQADGQYLMAAHLHLWWDVEDASTDTGVEVRWADALMSKSNLDAAAIHSQDFSVHVFPDQSHSQMRLVGSGLSDATWALVKSGQQVLPVQTGQYLGSERVKVQFANDQGLWGDVDGGPLQKLLVWEVTKP
jgi:hypothetical protein